MAARMLTYRMGAFGDTLLLALLFKRLRDHFPSVRLTLAANTTYAAPLLDAGLIHQILDGGAPPFHLLYDDQPSENDALSRLVQEYDSCVFYTADRSGELGKRLNLLKLERCCTHPPFPLDAESTHVCEWMMRPWPHFSAPARGNMKLTPSRNSLDESDKLLNKYDIRPSRFFVVHPGGGAERKWPPPEMIVETGQKLRSETGHQPVVAEGPADSEPSEKFQRLWGEPLPVLRKTPPAILGALLSKSSAYIGGDSGVSHLASLYAPCATILYGPHSDMRVWHPIGSHTRCVSWETA